MRGSVPFFSSTVPVSLCVVCWLVGVSAAFKNSVWAFIESERRNNKRRGPGLSSRLLSSLLADVPCFALLAGPKLSLSCRSSSRRPSASASLPFSGSSQGPFLHLVKRDSKLHTSFSPKTPTLLPSAQSLSANGLLGRPVRDFLSLSQCLFVCLLLFLFVRRRHLRSVSVFGFRPRVSARNSSLSAVDSVSLPYTSLLKAAHLSRVPSYVECSVRTGQRRTLCAPCAVHT